MSKSDNDVQYDAPVENDMLADKPNTREKSVSPGNSDLDHIRNILFGDQVRIVGERLDELEIRVGTTRRELLDEIKSQLERAGDTNAEQLANVQQSFSIQLQKQDEVHTKQLQQAQQMLTELIQSALTERIELASKTLQTELQQTRQVLTDNIQKLNAEFVERLQTIQSELVQRDDELRQELLAVTARLEERKATRTDLGQMLINLGQQLQVGSSGTQANSSDA